MDEFDEIATTRAVAEEIGPGSGAFLGNYPRAFSHIGVISSINLSRRPAAREDGPKKGTQ